MFYVCFIFEFDYVVIKLFCINRISTIASYKRLLFLNIHRDLHLQYINCMDNQQKWNVLYNKVVPSSVTIKFSLTSLIIKMHL